MMPQDVCSYNVEQARGDDDHNLITVIMKERGLDVQGAMDNLGTWHHERVTRFVAKFDNLPSGSWAPEVEVELKEYAWGIGNWVTADIEWGFESQRYFGGHGPDVRAHQQITLLPRKI